jgi:NTE family protein
VSDIRIKPSVAALRGLFERALHAGDAVSFALPGGMPLFRAGETADQLYWLRAGRLAVVTRPAHGEPRSLGIVRAGEPVGEMAMVAQATHSADVVALHDCEILALPRDVFFKAIGREPTLMTELARLMVARARETAAGVVAGEPSVFGFVAVCDGARIRVTVDRIAVAIRALGYGVAVIGAEAASAPTEWFSNVAHVHDFVLYVAEADEGAWRTLIGRQVDRLFRVGRGESKPPAAAPSNGGETLQSQSFVDLILLQSPTCAAPRGSALWSAALSPARLFQAREGDQADIERLARVITGQAVGLVLSGGAARAFAHIGAIRVLHERKTPIDFIGGVSMGAVIGLGLAMGWTMEELEHRIRRAFVESSPLGDVAIPMIALTHGRRVRARLAEHFGDRQICDLWLPFFCVSTNLTTGGYQLHRHGLAREAVRASLSLPGVLPPVIDGDNVLVDGAVMNNFPADVMRTILPGPIIGVDVGRGRSIDAHDLVKPVTLWRWLFTGAWRHGPPIVSLLMRAATVSSGRDLAAARAATDVLILPMIDHIEIRDWRSYDPAVAAGELAAREALDDVQGAVTDLRRRAPLEDLTVAPDQRSDVAPLR